ncbi:MAG: 4'-phosphopantetheinyl transferase family protein, partial [Candidatus Sericytochromatia bacterium]
MNAKPHPDGTPTLHLIGPDPELPARAEGLLTAAEREALALYTFPKRRRDWLLGRLAGKEALSRATGGDWQPEAITVSRHESGGPDFSGPDGRLAGWRLSISHGHGLAAGLATPEPSGVDLELFRAVEPGGWRFFLTEEERKWLEGEPLGAQGEILVWALKEAAYKAIRGSVRSVLELPVREAGGGRAVLDSP